MKSLSTVSNRGTFFKSSSMTSTRAISRVFSFMDDRGKLRHLFVTRVKSKARAQQQYVQYDVPTSIVERF